METTKNFFDNFSDTLFIGLFAVCGGVARVAMSPKRPRTWCEFLLSLLVSGFSGVVAYKVLCAYNVGPDLTAAASGIAGLLGDDILTAIMAVGREIRKQPAKVAEWWLSKK